jgi:hypothetical protein
VLPVSGWPFVGRTEELVEGLAALRADSGSARLRAVR